MKFCDDGTFKFTESLTSPEDYWEAGSGTYRKDGSIYKLSLTLNINPSQYWLGPATKEFIEAEVTQRAYLYLRVVIRETIDGVTKDQTYWFRSGHPLIEYANSKDENLKKR